MEEKGSRFRSLSKSYLRAAVSGDRLASRSSIDSAITAGASVLEVYENVISPALNKIGSEWRAGKLSIGEEHLATQITLEQMTILREKIAPKLKLGKRALVTTLPSDQHILGARMVADFFYADGWDVQFLGANTPVDEIVSFLNKKKCEVLLISISSKEAVSYFNDLSKKLLSLEKQPMLIVGGRALKDKKTKESITGADLLITDPSSAVLEARKHCGVAGSEKSLEQHLIQLGQNIQNLRSKKGINQQKLSELSELDRTYLSTIENGKKNLTFAALLRIAEALDIKISDLLDERQ